MDKINIRALEANEIINSYFLIIQSYPKLTKEEYIDTVKDMIDLGNFKIMGAFINDKMVGMAGYTISRMFYCSKFLRISNLIIDEACRNQGIGAKMMAFLEEKARNNNCKHIILDSLVENRRSYSLYFREGFFIGGFHFMKEL